MSLTYHAEIGNTVVAVGYSLLLAYQGTQKIGRSNRMKNSSRSFVNVGCTLALVGLVIGQNQSAFAGWSGLIDGFGKGWASVNVRSSTLVSNRVSTVNGTLSPSAAM